jgi:hypothetical protein
MHEKNFMNTITSLKKMGIPFLKIPGLFKKTEIHPLNVE